MTNDLLILGAVTFALYIYSGWQSWLLMGLTDDAPEKGNLLVIPYGAAAKCAFFFVLTSYLLSWPVWGLVAAVRAAATRFTRATGFTRAP